MKSAITLDGIGKRYFIGARKAPYGTLRESLRDVATAPFRRLGRLVRGHATAAAGLHEEMWALRDVSLSIDQGESVGIIGRNGAGKTTLLKILSRITSPSEGGALIRGRVGSLLEVGTGFHPELTGRENIYLNGSILGMGRKEIGAKFDEIVAFAEIDRFVETPVKFYSSGMYVRLAFAVAAHLEPEILLVDEVLAVGDAAFQKKCLGKMGDVAKEGRTVLFVSHSMVAVQTLCDRAICLADGRVVDDGEPAEVIPSYLRRALKGVRPEREWSDADQPGTDGAYLAAVRVRPEGGEVGDPITLETPSVLEFEYRNTRAGARVGVNFHLLTEQGVLAFEGGSLQDPAWDGRALDEGSYLSSCTIPAHLLNSGLHFVSVQLIKSHKCVERVEDALAFEVRDLTKRSGSWYGKLAGVVRPDLSWQTRKLGSGPSP